MSPFDEYPGGGGRVLLGQAKGANCRHEYGLQFMQKTGQTKCAYCGADFAESYEIWLTMALDHVVPVSVCRALGISAEWQEDVTNKVLARAACNSFRNRYKPPADAGCPKTLDSFHDLRDHIFAERRKAIQERHESEKAFFNRLKYELNFFRPKYPEPSPEAKERILSQLKAEQDADLLKPTQPDHWILPFAWSRHSMKLISLFSGHGILTNQCITINGRLS